jgi:hypothetical protein
MSAEIAAALFSQLSGEGVALSPSFFSALQTTYKRESEQALARYRKLALINSLEFSIDEERAIVDGFCAALTGASVAFGCSLAADDLPPWSRLAATEPAFVNDFLAAVAADR